jgi:hypothetical protein
VSWVREYGLFKIPSNVLARTKIIQNTSLNRRSSSQATCHHYHHHLAVRELGYLLTCSNLNHPNASLKAFKVPIDTIYSF